MRFFLHNFGFQIVKISFLDLSQLLFLDTLELRCVCDDLNLLIFQFVL